MQRAADPTLKIVSGEDRSSATAAIGEHLRLRQQCSELLTLDDSER